MMMSLGPVVFDLVVNLTAIEKESSASFARHEVVNAGLTYEATGEEESTISLDGVIHPEHFGGLGGLAALEAARLSHLPMPLMRGDFTPLGWVLIETLSSRESFLNYHGIGREIRFSVTLLKAGPPIGNLAFKILGIFT